MQYRINGANLKYAYYFNDTGEVYYYLQDDHERRFVSFVYESREVFSHEPGKTERYIALPLVFLFGQSDWVDVANLMARTAFNIPSHFKGYTRPKNHRAADLTLKNLEFIQLDREGQRPVSIYDYNGSIPYSMYFNKEEDTMEKPSMTILPPGGHGKPTPGKRTPTDSVKMDLVDRDRSVLAELLYSLITEKEIPAADALKILAIPGGYKTLELFLEGKDIVEERVVTQMAKEREDQERDRKGSPVSVDTEPASNFRPTIYNKDISKIELNIDSKL